MHSLVGIIVYAPSRGEALDKAKDLLELMCGEPGQPFDYFSTMDYEGARWRKLYPVVMKVEGTRGQRFIRRMMRATERKFRANLKFVRGHVERHTDDELWDQRYGDDVDPLCLKFRARELGEYRGGSIHLYDDDREGISHPTHCENALSKWRCLYEDAGEPNPYADLTVWVVPADVHY